MGQKVHPYGFRVGYNKDWHSHWFAKQDFAKFLAEDLKLKRDLKKKFAGGGVSHIDIDFGFAEAMTTVGIIGVKVWIYRGEILDSNASMARGTTTDPMTEVKVERGARRNDRGPRRDDRGGR